MKDIFPNYYHYTDEEFKNLWKDCKFILDTNILTHLYLYSKETREDLLEIFKRISDRLWVPYQVALEFQVNRLNVIAEQRRDLGKITHLFTDVEPVLLHSFAELQLKKRHSKIDGDKIIKDVRSVFDKVIEQVKTIEKDSPDFTGEDTLRNIIDSLLKNKIGPAFETQEQLDNIYKEGETRYKWERPPGFKDDKKLGAYYQNGLKYIRAYGDLLIWKQIILQSKKEANFKKIILLTNDEKEDWWWIESGKTIGPRPELIDEISTESKAIFYMYNVDQFLVYAKKFLGIESKPETAKEVDYINRVEQNTIFMQLGPRFLRRFDAYTAVYHWILDHHRIGNFIPRLTSGEFILDDNAGTKILYQVIYTVNPMWEVDSFVETYINKAPRDNDKLKLFVIVDSEEELKLLERSIKALQPKLPDHISIGEGILKPGVGDGDPSIEYAFPSDF
jgi:PIN like domain